MQSLIALTIAQATEVVQANEVNYFAWSKKKTKDKLIDDMLGDIEFD